jgi:hypothetical protein
MPWPHPRRADLPRVAGWMAALAVVLALANIPIDSDDLFINIRGGELIWQTGRIVRNDPFSYTMSDRLWINHEWLVTVIVYLVHRFGGFPALRIYQMLLLLVTFGLVIAACERARPGNPLIPAAVAFAAYTASDRFTVRPHLYNMLFTAVLMIFLVHLRRDEDPRRARRLLPLLAVLWVNFHSGALLLPVVLGVVAAGDTVARKLPILPRGWQRRSAAHSRKLAATGLLCLAGLLLNPFTYHAILYPLQQAGWEIYRRHVHEWKPLLAFRGYPFFHAYIALVGVFVLAALRRRRELDPVPCLVFVLYAWMTWRSVRFIALTAIAWPPLLFLLAPPPKESRSFPVRARLLQGSVAAVVALAALRIATHGYSITTVPRRPGAGLLQGIYPFAALDFLDRVGIAEPMLNEYDLGSLIIYHAYPRRKVFIDGRHQLYPVSFFQEYLSINDSPRRMQEVADRYGVNYFIMRLRPLPFPRRPMIYDFLSRSPQWRLVFWNDCCLIYLRDTEQNRRIIEENECRYFDPIYPESMTIAQSVRTHPEEMRAELLRILYHDPACTIARKLLRKYFPDSLPEPSASPSGP